MLTMKRFIYGYAPALLMMLGIFARLAARVYSVFLCEQPDCPEELL
jgi:cyclic lactone autoinducer peptide